MEDIKDILLKEAKRIAKQMIKDSDGLYVGSEETENVIINEKKYEIFVCAFWEKARHIDHYEVKGIGFEYEQAGSLIDF